MPFLDIACFLASVYTPVFIVYTRFLSIHLWLESGLVSATCFYIVFLLLAHL